MLERFSKVAVVLSALAAVGLGTWLGARAWAPLLWWSVAAFGVALVVGSRWGGRAFAPLMVLAYTFPAVMLLTHEFMEQAYWNIWMAGLLGAILGQMRSSAWAFPERWKWPLAYWALAVALVWPVVVAREADFSWALMSEYNIGNSALGGSPPVIAVFVMAVALTHLLGLLWFDAACVAYPLTGAGSRSRFIRDIVWPLVVSLLLGSFVAIYQGAVDITWLSGHQYAVYRRATAALDDGNAFGAAAGMWIGGLLALIALVPARWIRSAIVVGIGVAGAGLWATGSRMALAAAMVCVAGAVWFVVTRRKHPVRDLLIVGVPTIVVIAGFATFASRSGTANPVERVFRALPGMNAPEIRQFANFELWNRYGPYGTVSMGMVRAYPLSGIGVGSFNHIFPDESYVLTRDHAHMDNAQSWYRHQLAELGILGSAGWLLWLPMFVGVLWRTRGDADEPFAAAMVRGGLIGMGIISLVSMPTQALTVAFSVWVFIFWYLLLSPGAVATVSAPSDRLRVARWPLLWLGVVVFVLSTVWVGWRDLRPPFRAIRADWTYQLGFVTPEPSDVETKFRWIEGHAIEVLPVKAGWLKLTLSGGPPDMASNPLRFEVRRHGKVIIAGIRLSPAEDTWYVKVPQGATRMMLEFNVSRTWRPSDSGGTETRPVSLRVNDWTFVNEPPRGAIAID